MKKKTHKKKKKRNPKQSSLAKNVALLFLSLGLLAGVSLIFTSISNRSDLSLNPIQSTVKGLVAHDDKPQIPPTPAPQTEAKKSSAIPAFDYSFYKILNQKDASEKADEHYTVQIATFKSQAHAKSLAQTLREKNRLKCRIEKEGGLYCVRWGSYNTVSSAEQNRLKLSEKISRDCKVVKM
jgi:cell division septation protein DedD